MRCELSICLVVVAMFWICSYSFCFDMHRFTHSMDEKMCVITKFTWPMIVKIYIQIVPYAPIHRLICSEYCSFVCGKLIFPKFFFSSTDSVWFSVLSVFVFCFFYSCVCVLRFRYLFRVKNFLQGTNWRFLNWFSSIFSPVLFFNNVKTPKRFVSILLFFFLFLTSKSRIN